jgi:hypothetical protein
MLSQKNAPATHGKIAAEASSEQGEEALKPYSRIALLGAHCGVLNSGFKSDGIVCITASRWHLSQRR